MNIPGVIETILSAVDKVRTFLLPLPGILLLCTASRRIGLSSIIMASETFADTGINDPNAEVLKKFIYNVADVIKMNIHDDSVCFIAIPPNELRLQLTGSNALGPAILTGTNINYVFVWAIIR